MKKEMERRARVMGVNCYYNIENDDIRLDENSYIEVAFAIVLMVRRVFRSYMMKWFNFFLYERIEIFPDEGESSRDMYLKMEELSQNKEAVDDCSGN